MEPSNLEAVRAWNTRAIAPTGEEREAMRDALRKAGKAIELASSAEVDLGPDAWEAINAWDTAIARLDAATGGRE